MKKYKIKRNGYISVYEPSHPNSSKDGYIREHRYIMSTYIGRELHKNEEIHHINHIKDDNRLENLELMDKKEHTRLHNKGIPKVKKHKCIICDKGTNSKYKLCTYHYKNQYARLKKGYILDITEIPINNLRKHTEETKIILSQIAKRQPRKNGRFSNIHEHKELLDD